MHACMPVNSAVAAHVHVPQQCRIVGRCKTAQGDLSLHGCCLLCTKTCPPFLFWLQSGSTLNGFHSAMQLYYDELRLASHVAWKAKAQKDGSASAPEPPKTMSKLLDECVLYKRAFSALLQQVGSSKGERCV